MMLWQTILKVFLETSASLALAYGVFQLLRRFVERSNVEIPALVLLRTAQAMMLLAVVVTVALNAIPQKKVPRMDLSIRAPLADFSGNLLRGKLGRTSRALSIDTSGESHTKIKPSLPFQRFLALPWSLIVAAILGAGILIAFIRFLAGFFSLCRELSSMTRLKSLRGVVIGISDSATIPYSTRLLGKRWAVLPADLVAYPRNFKIALHHELQHHRQGDTRWVFAIELFEILFFFNPFIYRWRTTITELQELSCDDALIGRRGITSHEYGSCLLKVAEAALRDGHTHVGAACMSSQSHNKRHFNSFLKRRIEMLFKPKSVRPLWRWKLGIGLVMGTVSILLAYGTQQAFREDEVVRPNTGVVIVDEQIQQIADNAVETALERYKADIAFAVVGDPQTGRILAVANHHHLKTKFNSPHWALSLRVEPASTMKAFMTAAAIQNGKTTPNELHNCEKGHYRLDGHDYGDWDKFDKLSTADTVIMSSNICGIKVAQKLGFEGLVQALSDFGFGAEGTAVDFPEARPGFFLSPKTTLPSYFTATIGVGFGGIHLSPLEIVQGFAAIANGGRLMKPLMADAPDTSIQVVRQVISQDTSDQMKKILRNVVLRGTAREQHDALYRLAGKTSTAYSPDFEDHASLGGESQMAGFVGFAPYDKPRLVIYVGVMNPKSSKDHAAHGSAHAAPVFREIAEKVLLYYHVAPDNHS